jgi:hypothetical protein
LSITPQVGDLVLDGVVSQTTVRTHFGGAAGFGRAELFVAAGGRLLADDDDPPSNVSEASIASLTLPIGPPTAAPLVDWPESEPFKAPVISGRP